MTFVRVKSYLIGRARDYLMSNRMLLCLLFERHPTGPAI